MTYNKNRNLFDMTTVNDINAVKSVENSKAQKNKKKSIWKKL